MHGVKRSVRYSCVHHQANLHLFSTMVIFPKHTPNRKLSKRRSSLVERKWTRKTLKKQKAKLYACGPRNQYVFSTSPLLSQPLVNPIMTHTGIIRHIRPPQTRRPNRSLPKSQLRLPRPPSSPQPLYISSRRTRYPASDIYATGYAHRYRELREYTKVVQGAS